MSTSDFYSVYDQLSELNEGHKNNNNKVKQEVALPAELKNISELGITAKNSKWTALYSPDFVKGTRDFDDDDFEKFKDNLQKAIPGVLLNGKFHGMDTDMIKGHHYPIIELKVCTTKSKKPMRAEYFTKHLGDKDYIIFGAAFIHTEPNLSKKQRELCDKTYELFD